MKSLVVTADDFGQAPEINAAVELAHTRGILTAASLTMSGGAVADAVARARRTPSLRVGLHLTLIDGRPLLPPERVPDLVDAKGRFHTNMAATGVKIFLRPKVRKQLAAEIEAQFAAFRATGLPLDHVNAHHHYHVHPTIASYIVEIGKRYGMRALRVPLERIELLRRIEPRGGHRTSWLAAPWIRLLKSRARRHALISPEFVFGIAWSGTMNEERIAGVLRHLQEGLTEIYCHPATDNGFDGATPGYRYAEELRALMAPRLGTLLHGVRTGGFADFMKA